MIPYTKYNLSDGAHDSTAEKTGKDFRILNLTDPQLGTNVWKDGLKTGARYCWIPILNGGTVLNVTENGVSHVWHQYIDVSHLL